MERDTQLARDAWLALRCKDGEAGAFAALVGEMERPLLYYLTKLTGDGASALDVLQEVWIRVFRTIGHLREPAALRTWIYGIARGKALNLLRDEGTRRRAEERAAAEEAVAVVDDEPSFRAEEAEALHRGLDALDTPHREVLVLHFLEQMSVADISEIVGVPPGTVKSRLHHAKHRLRRHLEGMAHDTRA